MPFYFSGRLPLPNLKTYCAVSSAVCLASLFYGRNAFTSSSSFKDLYYKLLSDIFCLWGLVNMACCCLVLCGKLIQVMVLEELRVPEEQHLQDKFWNFVFYKIIFIFGVVNAQTFLEVLCWSAWFSILGFWHIIGQLCKDRYEYITSSPSTLLSKHIKLYTLITCIFLSSIGLSFFTIQLKYHYDIPINYFAFMMAECILLGLKSMHLLVRYTVQLADFSKSGLWDKKAKLVYYANLILEIVGSGVDLIYHFHMLIWSNVFLSLASLVLYWNIRAIFGDMERKFRKHRLFRKILKNVDKKFPLATKEELDTLDDHCAICWDNMETARKLPCGHFFHHACLCSWLQQDTSCPTCRSSLSATIGVARTAAPQHEGNAVPGVNLAEMENNQNGLTGNNLRNYFFYLDGQRIANWFPSFSIEVFHSGGRFGNGNEQEINDMAQQLISMFPHISREVIVADLQRTNSVEATADNILEENLTSPPLDEAPSADTNHLPASNEESYTSTTVTQTYNNELSDYESTVEESSGTEDMVQSSLQDATERKANRRNYLGDVRRRYLPKPTASQRQPETTSEPAPIQTRSDAECPREGMRTLIVEAIARRQNSSSQYQPPS